MKKLEQLTPEIMMTGICKRGVYFWVKRIFIDFKNKNFEVYCPGYECEYAGKKGCTYKFTKEPALSFKIKVNK